MPIIVKTRNTGERVTNEVKLQFFVALLLMMVAAFFFLWRRQIQRKRARYQGSLSESEYLQTTWKPALAELNELSGQTLPHLRIFRTVMNMILSLIGLLLSGAIMVVVGWDDPGKLLAFSGAFLSAIFLTCLYLLYDGGRSVLAYVRQYRKSGA